MYVLVYTNNGYIFALYKSIKNIMTFDSTTRELLLCQMEELKVKLALLQKSADLNNEFSREFSQFHEIEADVLRGNLETYKQALIDNDYQFKN